MCVFTVSSNVIKHSIFILAANLKLDEPMQYLLNIDFNNKIHYAFCDISLSLLFNNIKVQYICLTDLSIDLTLSFKSLCLDACRNKRLNSCKIFMGTDIHTLNLISTRGSFGNMTSLSLFFK